MTSAAAGAGRDAIVVGGGHNGLVAAAYLARAGRRVTVLERLDHVGGAAVSAHSFAGVDARLSRYSYLVSLLPPRITAELGARVRLARRRFSSYTPDPATAGATGLLIGGDGEAGDSWARVGAAADRAGVAAFSRRQRLVTQRLWPTLLEPLRTRSAARGLVRSGGGTDADAAWVEMIDEPIGAAISAAAGSDLVRGVLATDALIGTFARTDDPALRQNVCFLYHLLGGGTGDWDVPIGGMGAVTGALAAAATGHGAQIHTGAEVTAISPDGEVRFRYRDRDEVLRADMVLCGTTPTELARLLGEPAPVSAPGAQVKVNLVLSRLPRLRDPAVTPDRAFGGTFHVNETLIQLDAAHDAAASGCVPSPLPCEIYCHTLTDPSIMSPELRATGAHTLTVFGLHTPHHLTAGGPGTRDALTEAVLSSVDSVLAEPIREVVLTDAHGTPCIETKTTADLEAALNMTAGNIFHGALRWPFAEDDEPLDTPARRWGVATAHDRILLCGSGARRGGAVSGIGGHNAAMAALGR